MVLDIHLYIYCINAVLTKMTKQSSVAVYTLKLKDELKKMKDYF